MRDKYEYQFSNSEYFKYHKIENIRKYGVGTSLDMLRPEFIDDLRDNIALYKYLTIIQGHKDLRSVKLSSDHVFDTDLHRFKIVVRGANDSVCEKAIGDIVRLIEWGNPTAGRNYHSFEEGETVPGLEH